MKKLICLLGTLAIIFSYGVTSAQEPVEVKVINSEREEAVPVKVKGRVRVRNDITNPLLTQDVNYVGKTPISLDSWDFSDYEVPFNQRLVIELVTVFIRTNNKQCWVRPYIMVQTNGNIVRHSIGVSSVDVNQYWVFTGSQAMRLYVDPLTQITIDTEHTCHIVKERYSISGYVENIFVGFPADTDSETQ